ncbi:MAG: alpha-D-ribose 1-methylphosphonate 5-triphosphate diphosphatase [Alphaproteobacteria bacterium]|nr:alpha-D-ribose 1-methylphosphonate 5-triphosphate diphosphatase [Alphaproteobacteria bacterium]
MDLRITGGRALVDGRLEEASLALDDGVIAEVGTETPARATLDAHGLLVLPGIVDIHGDAFERQMMPRPHVAVATDIALMESDRQVVANGITTVFHGVTWSWEPGLRGSENARDILRTIESLGSRLAADTRFHLRHETYNVACEDEIKDWIAARRIHMVAFNNHLPSVDTITNRPHRIDEMAVRAGMSRADFIALVERLRELGDEVGKSIKRIAARAVAESVPLLSHDDASVEQRASFRALGCRVCEFPMNIETARAAADAGDAIVLGAPNVMRGKSHLGWVNATTMVADGLCSVLASDYYYPAPLIAPFRLAERGAAPLEKAWRLVSEEPARAAGLSDRGRIERGLRADVVVVDASNALPQVVAVMAGGRLVYLADGARISGKAPAKPAFAAATA